MNWKTRHLVSAVCLLHLSAAIATAQLEPPVSFNRDIRPLLSDRCFACHGPNVDSRESDLRLDIADGPDGAYQIGIEPGSPEDSELWHRIISDDEDDQMPPPDSHKPLLTKAEQQLFKRWIEAGAVYENFWAFEPARKPTYPTVGDSAWSSQPIDLHVLKQLESDGLKPSPEADDRTLIRRLTLDLTGLPPTLDELKTFLVEKEKSGDVAWENRVDQLLARNQYGEHMARYWLDLVRFADTNGMHKDFYRNNIAYRDWVIRAFNDSLGYDDFVRYQLAGDLYPEPTKDQLIASGFNRLHLIIDKGTALPEESFTKNVVDRVTSVGTAFMGITVQCAMCHDHKYDPVTQKDFYSLYAFFNNIDAQPETGWRPKRGLQEPIASFATPDQEQRLGKLNQRFAELGKEMKSKQAELKELESKAAEIANAAAKTTEAEPESEKDPDPDAKNEVDPEKIAALKKAIADLKRQHDAAKRNRDQFDATIERAMVMKERTEVRPTFMLVRGQYDVPGEQVQRNTPAFLPPLKTQGDVATRMDLAQWFVDPQHPLTARVAVNRIWQQFFGVGLVKTSEDFGAQGDVPSHPELLDHLTVSFVESGWDVKALVKQIVMSKTYRQSSRATPDQFKQDPDNRLLARGSRYRMDAEMIRDQILTTSGLLSTKMYGPSVKPPQPDGLWKAVTMIGERFKPDTGESIYRRSIYTYWKRGMPPPQMTILNAPIRDACIARRERTNTPSQALLLLNEQEYLKAARQLAGQVLEQKPDQRIDYIWEVITSRLPDTKERTVVQSLITELTEKYRDNPDLAGELCQGLDLESAESKSELAVWTIVGNTLYNLDITKTRD
jgi:hypothetical protein